LSTLETIAPDQAHYLPPTDWTLSPIADARAAAASSANEVERYQDAVKPVLDLLAALRAWQDELVPERGGNFPPVRKRVTHVEKETLDKVLKYAQDLARFSRAEFTSDETAREASLDRALVPFALSSGLLGVMAGQMFRQARDGYLTEAEHFVHAYAWVAWNVANELPGLGSWPKFLRTVQRHRDMSDSPERFKEVFDTVEQQWKDKIKEWFRNEGIYMASLQDPGLELLAIELIDGELERARVDMERAFSPRLRTEAVEEPELVDVEVAIEKLDAVCRDLLEIGELGTAWRESMAAELDYVEELGLDPVQTLDIEPLDPNARTIAIFAPHNDDETRVAGLIAEERAKGHNVILVVATDSSAGEPQSLVSDTPFDRREFGTLRKFETGNASVHAGVNKVIALNYGDSGMSHDDKPWLRREPAHRRKLSAQNVETVGEQFASIMIEYSVDTAIGVAVQGPYLHADHVATSNALHFAVKRRLQPAGHHTALYYVELSPDTLQATYAEYKLDDVGSMEPSDLLITTTIPISNESAAMRSTVKWTYGSQIAGNGVWSRLPLEDAVHLVRVIPEPDADSIENALSGSFVPAELEAAQQADRLTVSRTTPYSGALQVAQRAPMEVGLGG
jgi:LmbE family N-acetylglucosaminyl deacetylase